MTKRSTITEFSYITSVNAPLSEQVEDLSAVLAQIHPRIAHGLRIRYSDVYTALSEDCEPDEIRLRELRDHALIPTLKRSAPRGYYVGPDEDDDYLGCFPMREHLVYGNPSGASLLFISRDNALEGVRLQRALHCARTWADSNGWQERNGTRKQ